MLKSSASEKRGASGAFGVLSCPQGCVTQPSSTGTDTRSKTACTASLMREPWRGSRITEVTRASHCLYMSYSAASANDVDTPRTTQGDAIVSVTLPPPGTSRSGNVRRVTVAMHCVVMCGE